MVGLNCRTGYATASHVTTNQLVTVYTSAAPD